MNSVDLDFTHEPDASSLGKMLRRVEKKTGAGWIETEMKDLIKGDVFRMFDPPDWTIVAAGEQTEFIANGDPFLNKDKIWAVDAILDEHEDEHNGKEGS